MSLTKSELEGIEGTYPQNVAPVGRKRGWNLQTTTEKHKEGFSQIQDPESFKPAANYDQIMGTYQDSARTSLFRNDDPSYYLSLDPQHLFHQ